MPFNRISIPGTDGPMTPPEHPPGYERYMIRLELDKKNVQIAELKVRDKKEKKHHKKK